MVYDWYNLELNAYRYAYTNFEAQTSSKAYLAKQVCSELYPLMVAAEVGLYRFDYDRI